MLKVKDFICRNKHGVSINVLRNPMEGGKKTMQMTRIITFTVSAPSFNNSLFNHLIIISNIVYHKNKVNKKYFKHSTLMCIYDNLLSHSLVISFYV